MWIENPHDTIVYEIRDHEGSAYHPGLLLDFSQVDRYNTRNIYKVINKAEATGDGQKVE